MIRSIFIALVLVAAALVIPTAAAAQEGFDNTTVAPATDNETADDLSGCDVRVDRHTRICESSFEDGRSTLVIRSNITQDVDLLDMGSFTSGGVVPEKSVRLKEGRNRISLSGQKVNGKAGVSISTEHVTFSHIINTRSTLIGGPFGARDVQVAALSGALSVSLIVVIQSIRYVTGRTVEPERIA